MTTLVTTDGQLIPSGSGPFQATGSGMPSLAMSSRPFAVWVNGGTVELLGEQRVVSYSHIYRTQPWIAAAVNKRYRPIVRLPLKVYTLNSQGDKVRVREGRAVDLIRKPWDRAHQGNLKQKLYAPVYVHGNSLMAKLRKSRGAPPSSLKPLDWRYVQPIWNGYELEAWRTTEFGEPEFYGLDDVIHRCWWAPEGPIGVSPLHQLGVTIRIEDAAQRFQQAMLKNGARPPSAVTASEQFLGLKLEERQALLNQLREDLTLIYSGPENGGKPALLPPGLEWNSVGHTAVEAELIDQRKVAREEIAAVLDVPPPSIQILDKATFSNIDTQFGNLYTDTLGPDIVLGEQDLNAQLLDHPAFDGEFVEFDLAGVLRGKKLEEIQAIKEAIGAALMKPNEGRSVLNLPVSGDPEDPENPANKLYLPANNLQPLGSQPSAPPGGPQDPPPTQ